MAPKVNVGKETLRHWVLQAQIDADSRSVTTCEELSEIKVLEAKVGDFGGAIDNLKASAIFFSQGAGPSPALTTEFIDQQRERGYAIQQTFTP